MIGPALAAGMEQRNNHPIKRICALDPVTLEQIAAPASESEV
jgi:hypothetical protein